MLPLVNFLLRRVVKPKHVRFIGSVLSVALALLLGFTVYACFQKKSCDMEPDKLCDLTAIDALYMTLVTISTVGYGDLSPSSSSLRVFTICYVLIGVGYVFVALADLFASVLHAYTRAVKQIFDKFDSAPVLIDTSGDGRTDTFVSGRSSGISGHSIDVDGDGKADFILPPPAWIYWGQELIPAVLLLSSLQLLSAWIFTALLPELDFGTAFYHCMITATTVGYGDVAMRTQEARLFASLHIVVSVSWLAAVIGEFNDLQVVRQTELKRAELFTNPPHHDQIMALDHDGKGVDALEFVVGMMILLGVELCGKELTWDDVRPFIVQFNHFDVSNTGRLSAEDLEEYAIFSKKQAEASARAAAASDSWALGARVMAAKKVIVHRKSHTEAAHGNVVSSSLAA